MREYSVAKDKVVREVTAAAQFTRRGEGVYNTVPLVRQSLVTLCMLLG